MGTVRNRDEQEQPGVERGEEEVLHLPSPPYDARVQYGDDPFQFADLRLPEGNAHVPVVIVVHGGFWRAQYGLEHTGRLCAAITGHGFATYCIEYRRIGNTGGGFPGTFHDVGHAADYLRTIADSYGLDPRRVVALGHSAGGHLALWLAGRHRILPTSEIASTAPLTLLAGISLAGVVDLRRASELHLSSGATEQLIGGTPDQFPERYAAASPIELLPLGTPQFLVHGDDDDVVPLEISQRYHKAAVERGDSAFLQLVPSAGHFALIDPVNAAFRTVLETIKRAFSGPART